MKSSSGVTCMNVLRERERERERKKKEEKDKRNLKMNELSDRMCLSLIVSIRSFCLSVILKFIYFMKR